MIFTTLAQLETLAREIKTGKMDLKQIARIHYLRSISFFTTAFSLLPLAESLQFSFEQKLVSAEFTYNDIRYFLKYQVKKKKKEPICSYFSLHFYLDKKDDGSWLNKSYDLLYNNEYRYFFSCNKGMSRYFLIFLMENQDSIRLEIDQLKTSQLALLETQKEWAQFKNKEIDSQKLTYNPNRNSVVVDLGKLSFEEQDELERFIVDIMKNK